MMTRVGSAKFKNLILKVHVWSYVLGSKSILVSNNNYFFLFGNI